MKYFVYDVFEWMNSIMSYYIDFVVVIMNSNIIINQHLNSCLLFNFSILNIIVVLCFLIVKITFIINFNHYFVN